MYIQCYVGSLTSLQVSSSPVVSGPLWTGPLHDAAYVTEMLNLAEQWGWVGSGKGTDLEKLLKQMVDESDPRLPFGYIKLDEVLLQNCFHKLLVRLGIITSLFPRWQAVQK